MQLARTVLALAVIMAPVFAASGDTETSTSDASKPKAALKGAAKAPEPKRELFHGTVLLAQDALKKRGIKVAEEMKDQAVLETPDGELIPIAADWRGRAFFQDKRMRSRKTELVGYRRPGIPYLQVLVVFFINEKGRREEMDYWCDVCSIPMYEIKDCECCQGPIRFRLRPGKLPSYIDLQLKRDEAEPADRSN